MRNLMDNLENAADKLQELGKKAIDEAADQLEKVRPVLEAKAEQFADSAKSLYEKARPAVEDSIEQMLDSAKNAYSKAMDSLRTERTEILSKDSADAPAEEPAPQLTQEEEIDLDVQAQMEKIRAARSSTNIISDFISKKYGKDD